MQSKEGLGDFERRMKLLAALYDEGHEFLAGDDAISELLLPGDEVI